MSTVIDADPVATWVRELMAERTTWQGTASDLLRAGVQAQANAAAETSSLRVRWPNNPRALAGQLRRAQTFLHTVGIEIAFGRNGRAGTRIIRMSAKPENPPCETVTTDRSDEFPRSARPPPKPGEAFANLAGDADGADANSRPCQGAP